MGGRFPGSFSGTRTYYSFNDWGYWALQGTETLFEASIRENDALFATDPYEMAVTGKQSGSNPISGSAAWSGGVRAFDAHPEALGTPVEGDARIEIDFDAVTLDVDFTNFTQGHANMSWEDLPMENGVFSNRAGYTNLTGSFYGDNHEGVAGTFQRDRLDGVFGAKRQ